MKTIYPGNLFVVAAPSGAGKSSLLKALAGLLPEVSEAVMAATDLADRELRVSCGVLAIARAPPSPPPLPAPLPEWAWSLPAKDPR